MKCPNPNCSGELEYVNHNIGWNCGSCGFHAQANFPNEIVEKGGENVSKYFAEKFKEWKKSSPQIVHTGDDNKPVPKNVVPSSKYNIGWGSDNPGHIVYLIDLSASMGWPIKEDKERTNIKDVLDVVKKSLDRLLFLCQTAKGNLVPRFSASIIGYNSEIVTLSPHMDVNDIEELLDDTYGDLLYDISESGKAHPQKMTYMAKAFDAAYNDVKEWISQRKKTNPNGKIPAPYVINITDGRPEEWDDVNNKHADDSISMKKALDAAARLKEEIVTDEGNLLLFNIHYNGREDKQKELLTPVNRPVGNTDIDRHRQFLYDASSILPDEIVDAVVELAKKDNHDAILAKSVCRGSRAMISNSSDKALLANFVVFSSLTGIAKEQNQDESPI